MRTTQPFLFLSLILLIIAVLPAKSQTQTDTLSVYQVDTRDGNTFVGKIITRDAGFIKLRTQNFGEITIAVTEIKKIKQIGSDQLKDGQLWFESPHATRYFYMPNGYGLRKGEGYYQNAWVMFNQVSYGFGNYFSLGAGIIPTFFFGAEGAPVWITPKFTIPIKKDSWNLGAGAIVATYFGEESSSIGIVYGVSTFGSRDKNFSLGAGYGFAGDQWTKSPIISLGGTIRTGKKHYFITENYIISGSNEIAVLMWLGGRVVNPRIAVDYGLIIPAGADLGMFIAIPWLSITVPFGQAAK